MKTKTYFYLLLSVFGSIGFGKSTIAQVKFPIYKITGVVADSITKKPLSYVTVSLKGNQNLPVKTVLSKSDGKFSLESSAMIKLIFISAGYQTKTIAVTIKNSFETNLNLDTVFMAVKINRLKEVMIASERPIIKQLADRIIYDLQADPESKGSSVLTMVRKVPFITVDASDNILLKGNSSFKVLINGKPSGMLENNLKAVLQSMPASTIQSIEVITNPPSKYDAEGLTGIINIITNKKIANGYKGTLNFNESFPVGGPGTGTSFSIKQGKFGVTGYGGVSTNYILNTKYAISRTTFRTDETNLEQSGITKSNSRNGYFGTEMSYEIDSLQLVTVQLNISGNRSGGSSFQTSNLYGITANLQSYNLGNSNSSSFNGADAGINYQLGFKVDKNRLLTFSYRYSNYGNNQYNQIAIANMVNYTTPDYRQNNITKNTEQTFQIDYVLPVKNLNIEAGAKAILRKNTSDYQYLLYQISSSQFEVYPDFSDQFDYRQNVFSTYNSYRYNLKNWNFSTGIRVEKTMVDADFTSTASNVNQHILNVIPTIAVNKVFTDKSSLSFGFNRRIKRSNIRRLNPFVDRSNPDFISSGNPNLRPVLINNLQLSYSRPKKLSSTVALNYSFSRNLDFRTSVFDTAANITRITYQNLGKVDYLAVDFNIRYPINNNWNMSVNGNIGHFWISGFVNNVMIENNLLKSNITASSGYGFKQGWRLNASLNLATRSISDLQSIVNGFIRSNISCNKDLVKNKLSLSASVSNPFNKFRNNLVETKGVDFKQSDVNQSYFRSFSFSLNYNFGKLKQEIKKGKRGIDNDDILR